MTNTNSSESHEPKRRLPRLSRVTNEKLAPFTLMPRDVETVRAIYEYRAMTAPQIDTLLFAPLDRLTDSTRTVSSRCRNRLKLLFHAGFIYRTEQPQLLSEGRKPLVYFLDGRGAQLIAQQDNCEIDDLDWHSRDKQISPLFLDHLLATNDVRIAFTLAARINGCIIERWTDDKALKREHARDLVTLTGPKGSSQRVAVIPDGYFFLTTPEHGYHQVLEIDRATATGEAATWGRRDWARKVAAYLEYYRSGMYQERYKTKSIRILTVTTGVKRLANLKAITERVGGRARFWFTVMKEATPAKILTEPIWHVAGRDGLHALIW